MERGNESDIEGDDKNYESEVASSNYSSPVKSSSEGAVLETPPPQSLTHRGVCCGDLCAVCLSPLAKLSTGPIVETSCRVRSQFDGSITR
jgi:hypothetical protein